MAKDYNKSGEQAPCRLTEDEKKNPNSLVNILFSIRTRLFHNGRSRRAFAEQIGIAEHNKYAIPVTENVIEKIETNKQYIYYHQIEQYAERVGVPVFIILLLSRIFSIASGCEDGSIATENMKSILDKSRDIIDYLDDNANYIHESTKDNLDYFVSPVFLNESIATFLYGMPDVRRLRDELADPKNFKKIKFAPRKKKGQSDEQYEMDL